MKKLLLLLMICLLSLGCGCSEKRGLYSSETASNHFLEQKDTLDRAASWMIENPNVVYVLKGENSHFDDRCYKLVDNCSVYSSEPLTQAEIEGLQANVLPAFDDPILESIRQHPEGFAKYIFFIYDSRFFDACYDICKEYSRTGTGSLTDWRYFYDMTELGDNWFTVGYGG